MNIWVDHHFSIAVVVGSNCRLRDWLGSRLAWRSSRLGCYRSRSRFGGSRSWILGNDGSYQCTANRIFLRGEAGGWIWIDCLSRCWVGYRNKFDCGRRITLGRLTLHHCFWMKLYRFRDRLGDTQILILSWKLALSLFSLIDHFRHILIDERTLLCISVVNFLNQCFFFTLVDHFLFSQYFHFFVCRFRSFFNLHAISISMNVLILLRKWSLVEGVRFFRSFFSVFSEGRCVSNSSERRTSLSESVFVLFEEIPVI